MNGKPQWKFAQKHADNWQRDSIRQMERGISERWHSWLLILTLLFACSQRKQSDDPPPQNTLDSSTSETSDIAPVEDSVAITDAPPVALSEIETFKALEKGGDRAGMNAFFSSNSEPLCDEVQCLILFRQSGSSDVRMRGSFDEWSESGIALTPATADPTLLFAFVNGAFETVLSYKFLIDGTYVMDPRNPYVAHTTEGMASAVYKSGRSRLVWQPNLECPSLNNSRSLWIYLPKAYFDDSEKRFPVLYMQDGQNVMYQPETNSWHVDRTADELISTGRVEPLIIVAVESKNRLSEYVHVPVTIFEKKRDALLQPYIDCLIGVIMPAVNQRFRTRTSREHVGIAGASLGGSSSVYIAWTYSGYFSKAASFSGSFWIGEVGTLDWHQPSIREIIVANEEGNAPSDLQFYLDSGDQNDGKASYEADGWITTDWTRNTLIASGWDNRSEWDTDTNLATAPSNLPISTKPDDVPCLEWQAELPTAYASWDEYLRPENNLLSLLGKGHAHNGVAWRQRFGAMLSFLFPAAP